MNFDTVPDFEKQVAGKRLDIILNDTQLKENATFFEENDKIVKILAQPLEDATIISFFFRYDPQKIVFSPSGGNILVANILLGNRFSRSYQDVSSGLQGVTVLDRSAEDFKNPLLTSPYAHNWKTFFVQYESPVAITAPLNFQIPPFPVIGLIPPGKSDNVTLIPQEAHLLAERQAWEEIVPLLLLELQATQNIDLQKLLALTYGDVLLRAGNFEGAYKQLYLLSESYPKDQIGIFSSYLLSLLVAIHGDPYEADYRLRNLGRMIKSNHPLAPFHAISQAETSLATHQFEQMKQVLTKDDIAFPGEIEHKRELRQADLLYATGKPIKAYVAYQLVNTLTELHKQPFSLNGFCDTLYGQKAYQDSASCYRMLIETINESEQMGMAYYRESMAYLRSGYDDEKLIKDFSQIEDTFPGTEAGFRAALKKTDLRYLTRKDWSTTAIRYYNALAEKSVYRRVSEEAYFKEALLHHLAGDDSTAIKLIMTLLRNFRSGPVLPSAEALLIQMLPGELRRLVNKKDYTSALTLAKQNRRLFDNNWVDIKLLADLGLSYQQLGIYDEALRLYRYLVEIVNIEDKEKYYLPMTRIAYDKGDYSLVEDFATQYSYNYPQGQHHDTILYLRLSSLYASDQIDLAISLLPALPLSQDDYRFLASSLYYSRNRYQQVADTLQPLWLERGSLPENQIFILAESLYQLDRKNEAEPIFEKISSVKRFEGQSLYRRAEISRDNGDEMQALNLLRTIAEKDDSSLWKKFAERELQFKQMSENL